MGALSLLMALCPGITWWDYIGCWESKLGWPRAGQASTLPSGLGCVNSLHRPAYLGTWEEKVASLHSPVLVSASIMGPAVVSLAGAGLGGW